jgi:hypothetical protein
VVEKNIKSRIVHKHGLESVWSQVKDFIPFKGELIIYDKDDTHDYERFKIGDGETEVNTLPFAYVTQAELAEKGYATKDDLENIQHPVTSVNGKTGAVSLTAEEVGAIPANTERITISSTTDGEYPVTKGTVIKDTGISLSYDDSWDEHDVQLTPTGFSANYCAFEQSSESKNARWVDLATVSDVETAISNIDMPSTDGLASEEYVDQKVAGLVDSSPEALNTLNELATALGNDANFAATMTNELAKKANKADLPNIAPGDGSNSIVVGDGDANGKSSLAGGSTDKSLITDIVGTWGGLLVSSPDAPVADGDVSISYGAGTVAHTAGTAAMGVNSHAGCLGYYFWDIDFDSNTITLSTNQKAILTSRKKPTNLSWAKDDVICIINNDRYVNCSKITAVDATNGTITVDNLPFIEIDDPDTKTPDDRSVYVAAKPASGEVKLGFFAYSRGYESMAVGAMSNAIGYKNIAADTAAFVTGRENIGAHATLVGGLRNEVLGKESFAIGRDNLVKGNQATAAGNKLTAIGDRSHIEGNSSNKVDDSIAYISSFETVSTVQDDMLIDAWNNSKFALAKGNYSHVEGTNNLGLGDASHVEGSNNLTQGGASHAEGTNTKAIGAQSHAEGYNTQALDAQAHAEGNGTIAKSKRSHAEGGWTQANATNAHAEGFYTYAVADSQHVQGRYNKSDASMAHIVGNGTGDSEDERSNAHTLDWSGNAWYAGDVEATSVTVNTVTAANKVITTDVIANKVAAANEIAVGQTHEVPLDQFNVPKLYAINNISIKPEMQNGDTIYLRPTRKYNLIYTNRKPGQTGAASSVNWEVQADGSFMLSGTAGTSSSIVTIYPENKEFLLPPGSYEAYGMQVQYYECDGDSSSTIGDKKTLYAYADTTYTVPAKKVLKSDKHILITRCALYIKKDTQYDNIVYHPYICCADGREQNIAVSDNKLYIEGAQVTDLNSFYGIAPVVVTMEGHNGGKYVDIDVLNGKVYSDGEYHTALSDAIIPGLRNISTQGEFDGLIAQGGESFISLLEGTLRYSTTPEAITNSDWSENSENSIAYIKNRTHWYEKGEAVFRCVLTEQLTELPEDSADITLNKASIDFETGENVYLIQINGKECLCDTYQYIGGNGGGGGGLGETEGEEPESYVGIGYSCDDVHIAISSADGVCSIQVLNESVSYPAVLSIYKVNYHKLDGKYLPDNVPTTSAMHAYVDSAIKNIELPDNIATEEFVANAISNIDDKDTTYSLSVKGPKITLTDKNGNVQSCTHGAGPFGKNANPGSANTGYYAKIATITHTRWNADIPITFVIVSRYGNYTNIRGAKRQGLTDLTITFKNVNNKPFVEDGARPGLYSIKYDGETITACIVEESSGVWGLYVQKVGAWDKVYITEILTAPEMLECVDIKTDFTTSEANSVYSADSLSSLGTVHKATRLYPRIFSGINDPTTASGNPVDSDDGDVYILYT